MIKWDSATIKLDDGEFKEGRRGNGRGVSKIYLHSTTRSCTMHKLLWASVKVPACQQVTPKVVIATAEAMWTDAMSTLYEFGANHKTSCL